MVIVALLTAGGAATFGKMAEADQTFLIPAAACGLVYLIILWIESRKLARSFGKGFIYGLLLFFFGIVTLTILVCLGTYVILNRYVPKFCRLLTGGR